MMSLIKISSPNFKFQLLKVIWNYQIKPDKLIDFVLNSIQQIFLDLDNYHQENEE